jgi:ABC-type multidrug transport system permease subunit
MIYIYLLSLLFDTYKIPFQASSIVSQTHGYSEHTGRDLGAHYELSAFSFNFTLMFALFAFCLQLQNAVKLLDSGAVRATRFLWRYPIARMFLLFYLVFVHLFLMYLIHRLQEQAEAQEVAAMTNNVFRL